MTYCERTENPKSSFDSRSFRWIKSGQARLLVGCPGGHWSTRAGGRCRVGLRAYKILVPATRKRCKRGRKIRK